MEKYLYLLLNEMNISYITISHRPILEGMHCKLLCINGDAEKTYTYKVLRTPKQLRKELDAGLRVEAGPVNQVVKNISAGVRKESFNFSIEEARLTKLSLGRPRCQ